MPSETGQTSRADEAAIAEAASHLRLAVARAARRLRQEASKPGGERLLTPSSTSALAAIERCGPLTPSELADIEGIKRPSATRMLAKLEAEGLVERAPDPTDGRSSLVAATREGREQLGRVRRRKNAFLARKMKGLPAEDVATLERAAEILEAMVDREREGS